MHTSAELKPIRIAVPTVLCELRCGHITSVYSGMGWRELFSEMCSSVVPCATVDEESCSSLKTWILCGSTLRVTRYKETGFGNVFFQIEPLHKILLSAKVSLNLILELPCALYSIYSPSVGVVGLAEYICTHPILNFYRGRPRLRSRGR